MRNLALRTKQAVAGTTAALFAAAATAGPAAEAVSAGVDKAELTAIGLVVLGIAGVILFIRSGRKAANG
ncbi:hypothetical protein [Pseudomonas sp. CGJS7]|uniref:hypothetical protein n=1 Tax=Pseudomonas sp. CGJS7 TaxID=3109348 RepID=UPI00300914B5